MTQKRTDQSLDSLVDDRTRIERIVDRLDVTGDLPERADLASELVRAASRHEYIIENGVVPALDGRLDIGPRETLTGQRQELRETMDYIHRRTRHLAARNAHADDPQGLEDAIVDASGRIRALLAAEDAVIGPVVGALDPDARQDLKKSVDKASKHAAERPKPARTAVGRMVSNLATKIDHAVEDVATPDHAGAETIDG